MFASLSTPKPPPALKARKAISYPLSPDSTRSPAGASASPWYESDDSSYVPGITAVNVPMAQGTEKKRKGVRDRIDDWFKRPLEAFKDEDALVCVMVCLPLIEKYVRFKVREGGRGDQGGFAMQPGGSNPNLANLKQFLELKQEAEAELFYNIVRCGFLHRAMPNQTEEGWLVSLRPELHNPPVEVKQGQDGSNEMIIYVWSLRDKVVSVILSQKNKMWTRDDVPLLDIFA